LLLDLGVPKKKIIRLLCSQVEQLSLLDNKAHYKIVLSGTPEEIKMLKISTFISHLTQPKIVYKTISQRKTKNKLISNKGFYDLLVDRIKDDPDLWNCLQNL
jgi:hypothetical protein